MAALEPLPKNLFEKAKNYADTRKDVKRGLFQAVRRDPTFKSSPEFRKIMDEDGRYENILKKRYEYTRDLIKRGLLDYDISVQSNKGRKKKVK
jgi:hypothetical protein